MIRVVVADDQAVVRAALAMLLAAEPDIEVVGQAADGEEAVMLARSLRPDVLVMDLRMPVLDGIQATAMLTADGGDGAGGDADHVIKILILTMFNDYEAVCQTLRAGASGYLLKHAAPSDLSAAVREVAAGNAWLDPKVAGSVIEAMARIALPGRPSAALEVLTPREREILTLMAEGLNNHQIAARLVVSEATVKTHVGRVIMKTGSRDRTQAVVLAYQSGLVVPRRR